MTRQTALGTATFTLALTGIAHLFGFSIFNVQLPGSLSTGIHNNAAEVTVQIAPQTTPDDPEILVRLDANERGLDQQLQRNAK